jgi:Flp pilus assembly protein TadG
MRIPNRPNRRGVAVVEAAIVLPIVIFMLLAIVLGASLVFTQQEVATLAREGTRYASVRGTDYALFTGNSPATADDVYNNGILPRMMTLDQSRVSYSVSWDTDNRPGNTVIVTLNYTWSAPILGDVSLSSTSKATVAY